MPSRGQKPRPSSRLHQARRRPRLCIQGRPAACCRAVSALWKDEAEPKRPQCPGSAREPHGTQRTRKMGHVSQADVSPGCRQSTIAHTALGIKGPAGVRAEVKHLWPWWDTREASGDEDSASASPGAHVPAAVGGVILQTVQQRAVDLGDVLSAHSFVRRPFCPHTNSLANPKIKNV